MGNNGLLGGLGLGLFQQQQQQAINIYTIAGRFQAAPVQTPGPPPPPALDTAVAWLDRRIDEMRVKL